MIRHLRFMIGDAWGAFGLRVPLLVALMVASGLTEGLAVTVALPLLGTLGGASPAGGGGGAFVSFLAGLPGLLHLPEGPAGVGILMVGLLLLSALSFIAQARLSASLQVEYVARWQVRLFEAAMVADQDFVVQRRGGDLVNAIVTDVTRIGGCFYHACLVLAALVNLIIYLVLALLVSPVVSLAVLVLGFVLLGATRPFLGRAYALGSGIGEASADVQSLAGEYVGASKIVKVNAAEAFATERFREAAYRLASLNFQNSFDVQKAKAVFEFGGAAGIAFLLIGGPLLLSVSVATVIVVLALFVRLLPRVTALQQGLQALATFLPALASVHALLVAARKHAERPANGPLPQRIGEQPTEIVFEGVRVRRGERVVLRDVDLIVPAGQIVALVGASGSGKSTLVDAILGLVPLEAGRITVAGHDLSGLPLQAWRRLVGYVGQDTALLAGSVAENVRFGTQADGEAIGRALRRAAAEFVGRTGQGDDLAVGDRGARLSGGERQRLGLARALVLPRRLYVLDEATSALDNETEARVIETVSELAGEATVIVIAHRFSAIRKADLIYVLEDGVIVEAGSWDELDRPGRRFRTLKSLQDVQAPASVPLEPQTSEA